MSSPWICVLIEDPTKGAISHWHRGAAEMAKPCPKKEAILKDAMVPQPDGSSGKQPILFTQHS